MIQDAKNDRWLATVYVGLGVMVAMTALGCKDGASRDQPKEEPPKRAKRQLVDSRSRALELEQLQALGYVEGTYDPQSEQSGVLVHVEGRTQDGYNFYSSRNQRGAQLIRMDGKVVHEWKAGSQGRWHHAELLPTGDVIVTVKDERLSRYDASSKHLWSVEGRFHHDLWVADERIYALVRTAQIVDFVHPTVKTLVDVIQIRSMDGELLKEISVLDAIHDSPYRFLLPSISPRQKLKKGRDLDVLHTNHIEVFDGRLAERGRLYSEGNILISMRNINAVAILDGRSAEVVWIWGPTNITFQHQPTLLDNGHILLFDNGLERSRVLEIDPESNVIVWEYAPRSGFFSATRGGNQRLPNGNTLITESDRGYVFEIDTAGEIVWKFANPVVNRKKKREAIWRMTRVAPETLTFLN